MADAPLLSSQDLSKSFGVRPLFQGISLVVGEGERVALIGPNGSGKSTLLRILSGIEDSDTGQVTVRSGLRPVYVPQVDRFDESMTVSEVVESGLIERGQAAHESARSISLALGAAGFSDRSVPVAGLSGGWRKRLALARGLAADPDLLLLDEPTNHLDIDGVRWLEKFLAAAPFALIFVSHDRYFIEHLATRVVEINKRYPNGYFSAPGTYADFLEAREAYLVGLRQTQASLANRVRREVEWLRAGVKARTTKQKARIQEAGRLIDELKGFSPEGRTSQLEFSASNRRSKELIKLDGVSKGFGGRTLFKDISLVLSPGVRLGIAGPNGSGKTTFMKTLLGELEPDTGRVIRAQRLSVAFFDQQRRQLDPGITLRKALAPEGDSVVFNGRSIHVASWASRFLFSNDQLAIPVGSLSGGEQARVLLAKVMLEPADILLFDEPTNDLDIPTLEILEESFLEFPGAIVLVTHDRYLLDRTATVVLGLSAAGSTLFGDLAQWEEARAAELSAARSAKQSATTSRSSTEKTPTKLGYSEQRELGGIEAKILAAEAELEKVKADLSDEQIASDASKLADLCERLAEQEKLIERLYARWEELEEKRRRFGG